MPSGRTHDLITLWTLPPIVGVTFLLTSNGKHTLILGSAFLFSGLMFGPDLDIHSIQFKRWGQFRWIWLPYQNHLRHRCGLSHGPILGTTIRVLYLLCLLTLGGVLAVGFAQLIWGFYWNWQEFALNIIRLCYVDYQTEAIALFLGLELGAMSHSFTDWSVSAYKRYQKTGKRIFSKPKKKQKKR